MEVEDKNHFSPLSNVFEKEDHYQLEIELPGLDKKDIAIEVKDHILTIKGEKKYQKESKESKNYFYLESRYGEFSRSWKLPQGVDTTKINASQVNGILSLEIPKTGEEKTETQKITIK